MKELLFEIVKRRERVTSGTWIEEISGNFPSLWNIEHREVRITQEYIVIDLDHFRNRVTFNHRASGAKKP